MAGDLMRIAKGLVRALIGAIAGFLVGYEYYSFTSYYDNLLYVSIAMGVVTAIVVFFTMASLGKHND